MFLRQNNILNHSIPRAAQRAQKVKIANLNVTFVHGMVNVYVIFMGTVFFWVFFTNFSDRIFVFME